MAPNIDTPLSEGENMLLESRVHNFVFYTPATYALIALALGTYFHWFIGAFIMVLNLYPLYTATVNYLTTRLVLTDKKVMGRSGFLTRDWTQLKLSRIETAKLEEPIVGRWFGFSTVIVRGTGSGSISFHCIADGNVFIKHLEKLLDEIEDNK